MKKILFTVLSLAMTTIAFTSCDKDDKESKGEYFYTMSILASDDLWDCYDMYLTCDNPGGPNADDVEYTYQTYCDFINHSPAKDGYSLVSHVKDTYYFGTLHSEFKLRIKENVDTTKNYAIGLNVKLEMGKGSKVNNSKSYGFKEMTVKGSDLVKHYPVITGSSDLQASGN